MSESQVKQVEFVIIGAGISGLSAAYYLQEAGKSFVLLEKGNRVGGALHSEAKGNFLLERGANTVAMNAELHEMIQNLGLEAALTFTNGHSKNRYIYRDQRLHALSQHPLSLFRSKLLSLQAKIRLLKEPFIKKSHLPNKESVAEFFSRRLGKEAYQYLVASALQGVYAGIPETMSLRALMPDLLLMEQKHGSLLKGIIARQKEAKKVGKPNRKIFSFTKGMGQLSKSLKEKLGDAVSLNTSIDKILHSGQAYEVRTNKGLFLSSQLIYAAPAHAAGLLSAMAPELTARLLSIPYAPMILLYLGYDKEDIGQICDGFGFLIPPKEKKALLGAIWNSAIFEGKSPAGTSLFTLFVGGASHPDLDPRNSQDLVGAAQKDFENIMGIKNRPIYQDKTYWRHAIPQYGLQHVDILASIEGELSKFEGLHVLGNYLRGVSVGDCVKGAKELVGRV